MTADDQAAAAARAPRIEPLTRLATGGMADIWLARELGAAGLERFVVVKRLLPHLARDPEIVDMFVSEARFVARLVHPNVVQIHELGEDDEGYFLVMEYVEGCSVRELMVAAYRAGARLPPEIGICIIEQAARGAHAAHELTDPGGQPLGLVHRDISPHNLMIGKEGDVKLLDFGIAKATEAGGTHTGSLKGKCSYMSPEQCRAFRLDRRSDVFSLGIVLWELLVGKRLFQRDAEFASMEAIVTGDYQLPSEVRPELPAVLDPVLAKALSTKVAERYQTADDFRRALLAAAEEGGLRTSRDRLGATLVELLGSRLEQRERALRRAATSPSDPSGLRDALMPSDSSLRPSGSGTGRSNTGRTGSDDVVTVVHKRSSRPAPGAPDASAEETLARLKAPDLPEDVTQVDADRVPTESSPSAPGAVPPPVASAPAAVPTAEASAPAAVPPPAAVPATAAAAEAEQEHPAATSPSEPPWESVAPPPPARWGRWVLAVVALVAVVGGIAFMLTSGQQETVPDPSADAGVVSADAAVVLTGPPLRFVVAPTVAPDVMKRELAPFDTWLGVSLGRPVELIIADSYQDAANMVTSGRADLGLFPPLLFVQTMAEAPDVQPLVLRLYDGARASDGYLLVRDDKTINDAKDLRGRMICFVDRESTTGFLLPRIWLRGEEIDPDVDVKSRLSGDHLRALRDLAEGKCDAAAVYSGAYLSAQKQGISVGKMRVLTITGRVPQDVLAATPHMTPDDAAKLRDALIGFEPKRDIGESRVGAVLGISGFAKYESKEFDVIREAAVREGLVKAPDAGP